ncbi:MAG: preprotein translocase subunit SecG [Magnetococcales bacterium]|nr:preprotein translocase subunit SecG [Magnetococcales bacterium]
MTLILQVVHVLIAIALIFVVLLQRGSGSDMGAAFGGTSSQSLFGAQGSGGFLGKLTAALATIFMTTSLVLAFFSNQQVVGSSIMEGVDKKQQVESTTTTPVPEKSSTAPASTAPVAPPAASTVDELPARKPVPTPALGNKSDSKSESPGK